MSYLPPPLTSPLQCSPPTLMGGPQFFENMVFMVLYFSSAGCAYSPPVTNSTKTLRPRFFVILVGVGPRGGYSRAHSNPRQRSAIAVGPKVLGHPFDRRPRLCSTADGLTQATNIGLIPNNDVDSLHVRSMKSSFIIIGKQLKARATRGFVRRMCSVIWMLTLNMYRTNKNISLRYKSVPQHCFLGFFLCPILTSFLFLIHHFFKICFFLRFCTNLFISFHAHLSYFFIIYFYTFNNFFLRHSTILTARVRSRGGNPLVPALEGLERLLPLGPLPRLSPLLRGEYAGERRTWGKNVFESPGQAPAKGRRRTTETQYLIFHRFQ